MTKRLCLLVALLLGFAASGRAETKTDTIYFEFELDEGVSSAQIAYRMALDGVAIDYNDGQEHDRIICTNSGIYPFLQNTITVRGSGYGRIYYTYEQPTEYYACISSDDYEKDGYAHGDIRVRPLSSLDITLLDVSSCTALTRLNCSINRLTDLDVSGCTALTWLSCSTNRLTALDVSKNTALTGLSCSSNRLTALDVSKNTALTSLDCRWNLLTSLNASGCSLLKSLEVTGGLYAEESNGTLTSLDVSGCSSLTELDCYCEQLTRLDASGCTSLKALKFCSSSGSYWAGSLKILDVSGCTALKDLSFYKVDSLTSLDVSGCSSLTKLSCGGKQLTSLDVSGCTALTSLDCSGNRLTSLDVSSCTALERLDCYYNQLKNLNASGCTSLITIRVKYNASSNDSLSILDVSGCSSLTELDCYDIQLTALDVSGCSSLTELRCYENQLTALDVSGCTALESLGCGGNQLTSLDVSKNTALTSLGCGGNQLTSLDVSGCAALTSLDCSENQLTSLDVSGCTALTSLHCTNNNQLTALDVSGCTALTSLYCSYNRLTALDVSGCTALTELRCDKNQLTNLDVSSCTALTYLKCDNNHIPLSLLYNIYNLSSDWTTFYAEGQSDSISLLIEEPWDLSSERLIGSTVSDYDVLPWYSISYIEQEFVFQFHESTNDCKLYLRNNAIPGASFWWYISVKIPDGYFSISVSEGDGGYATISGNGIYQEGEEVTITAYPYSDYRFVNWTKEDGTVFSTEAEYTFTVTENLELTANFVEKETFTVNFSVNHSNWGYTYPDYVTYYQEGDEVTIYAYPYSDYRFVNWTKADGSVFSTEAEYTFVITENLDLTANFEKISDIPDDDVANENREEDNFAVYVQGRTIYLSEPRGRVQVFNVAGQCVYSGSSTVISVPNSGVYIVKVGTQNYKVVVR